METALLRAVGLYGPFVLALVAATRLPDRRRCHAATLATAWNLPTLLAVNVVAEALGWWRFDVIGGTLLGQPVDLLIGWAILWGAVPILLLPRLPLAALAGVALLVDVVLMPGCAPVVVLGDRWLVGEALALALVLVPGRLLARWTVDDVRVRERVLLQATAVGGLLLFVLPSIVLEQVGETWALAGAWRGPWLSVALQLAAVPALLGVTAALEFAERGRGTPVPFDPPRRLVTSGPYAYVANPMQLSMVLLLLALGGLLGSWWVAATSLGALAYGVGFAAHHEGGELGERYGDRWSGYRTAVRAWWPRWRPVDPRAELGRAQLPVLWVSASCATCQSVGLWLLRRRPRGVVLRAAELHPTSRLRRMTYEPGDGTPAVDGVTALARALEHLHLGWALAGWTLRLPLVAALAQRLADGLGFGPRDIPLWAAGQHGPPVAIPWREERGVRGA